ncbi:hypothetical protein GCM10008992_23620 [Halorubrum aquaticum]
MAFATGPAPRVTLLVSVPSGAPVYFAVAFLLERRSDWGIERNLRVIGDGVGS